MGEPMVCVRPPGWTGQAGVGLEPLLRWVLRAEQLGFDGVFFGDRLLDTASDRRGVVYGASMLDVSVLLSAVAARTTRLRFGPLVLVLPYRHPVQLAKLVGSLDQLSGGRLILGAGMGWNRREFDALGIPMGQRAGRLEESIELLRQLVSGHPVTYSGDHWQLTDVAVSPPSARVGGPPVWMASFSPGAPVDFDARDLEAGRPAGACRSLDRIGRIADGWVPLVYSAAARHRISPDALGAAWRRVQDSAAAAGRTRADIDFVLSDWCYVLDGPRAEDRCREALAAFFTGTWEEALRTYMIGTADEVVDQLRAQVTAIDRVDGYVLTPLSNEPEQLEALGAHVLPRIRPQVEERGG